MTAIRVLLNDRVIEVLGFEVVPRAIGLRAGNL
jgi:hypothetical protein